MNKKREIEMLRPREICPKHNHSFHTSSNDCDKSLHNRSFEKSIQETEKVSSRMQNEFGQLKTLIQKRRDEIEKQQRQQALKLSISISQQTIKQEKKKQKQETPQFNYYQTFKPLFAKLNSLIKINQESIKQSNEPEQMFQLVQQLVKEFVIPTLEQSTLTQLNSKGTYLQTQSSNFIKQLPSHQYIPKSIEQSICYKNVFELQYKNPNQFYSQVKNNECGYYEYFINDKLVSVESINSFNISKTQSCTLINSQSNIQLDIRQIKQCLIQQQIFSIDEQYSLVPINHFKRQVIFILNYPTNYCKQIQLYISMSINNQQCKFEYKINQEAKKYNSIKRFQKIKIKLLFYKVFKKIQVMIFASQFFKQPNKQ